MPTFVMPDLYCPFPSAVNEHAAQVHAHTIEWVNRFGLFSDHARRRLPEAKFAWLMARTFTTAPLEQLQIFSDWNNWLFARDDLLVETGIGRDPCTLESYNQRFLEILPGSDCTMQDEPLAYALQDICQRLYPGSSSMWIERFIMRAAEHFAGNIWEATNHDQGIMPDTTAYFAMRPFSGAVYTDIVLIEVAQQIELPPDVHDHPLVQRLMLITNNVICWSNDIFSLSKEIEHGEIHNLVLILQHEQQLTCQEAVDRVATLHNAEVRDFITLTTQLPSFGAHQDADLQRFITGLRSWMRGNLDWSLTTARYQPGSQMYEERT